MALDDRLQALGNGYYLFQAKAPEVLTNRSQRKTSDKIISYGKGNNYPQELIRAVMSSPIAQGCAETQAKYIAGDGFAYPEGEFGDYLQKLFTNDFLQRISYDFAYHEGFAFQVRFNLNKEVVGFEHIPFSTVRLGELNEQLRITYARLSADWEQTRQKEYKPSDIELYDELEVVRRIDEFATKPLEFQQWGGMLYYARRYKPGQTYYPRPKYESALKWIYADGQIQEYHANNIDNCFTPPMILYVPFDLKGTTDTGETKEEAFKKIIKEKTGAKAAGEILTLFGKDKESVPQVIPFTVNSNHELFIALSNLIRDNITSAFQIPPILAGIQQAGKLGMSQEIANSIEMYYNGVIKHDVNFILGELNKFVKKLPGYSPGNELGINSSKPFTYLDPQYTKYLYPQEVREEIGYEGAGPLGETPPQEGGGNV